MSETLSSRESQPAVLLHDEHVAWHSCAGTAGEPVAHVRGYAHDGRQALENASLAKYLQQLAARGRAELEAAIPKLNGAWACVVVWPTGDLLAAVDRMRSIPLFLRFEGDRLQTVSASMDELTTQFSPRLDEVGELKFLL